MLDTIITKQADMISDWDQPIQRQWVIVPVI